MTRSSKSYPFRRLWAVSLLLPLLCACSLVNDKDDPVEPSIQPTSDHYINLSIVVSSGNENTMRAPLGGEDGDGREAGFERENKVTGITFMLYEVKENTEKPDDYDGINESQEATLKFVRYYPVSSPSREEAGSEYTGKHDEAIYTTGNQPLNGLDLTKKYRALVVANRNMTDVFIEEKNTVRNVCEKTLSQIYTGSGIGVDAVNFVMSQEAESPLISFDNGPTSSVTTANGVTNQIYEFDNIRIERLAARVDFWMKNATYNETYNGYEYSVKMNDGSTGQDKFVLTAVTPFNLYKDTQSEFIIKHIQNSGNFEYFADETESNYVIDPSTNTKSSNTDYYKNPLSELVNYDKNSQSLTGAEGYYQSTKMLHDNKNVDTKSQYAFFERIGEDVDNFILCYPKENILNDASPLYYHATGLAIEGDYYKADGSPEHYIYYGFLRHQGEPFEPGENTYTIKTVDDLKKELAGNQQTPMNFSVVRNNIYRISIDEITEKGTEDPKITLRIVVKNWDEFKHDTIFM